MLVREEKGRNGSRRFEQDYTMRALHTFALEIQRGDDREPPGFPWCSWPLLRSRASAVDTAVHHLGRTGRRD